MERICRTARTQPADAPVLQLSRFGFIRERFQLAWFQGLVTELSGRLQMRFKRFCEVACIIDFQPAESFYGIRVREDCFDAWLRLVNLSVCRDGMLSCGKNFTCEGPTRLRHATVCTIIACTFPDAAPAGRGTAPFRPPSHGSGFRQGPLAWLQGVPHRPSSRTARRKAPGYSPSAPWRPRRTAGTSPARRAFV